jgi:hypothetical protein
MEVRRKEHNIFKWLKVQNYPAKNFFSNEERIKIHSVKEK